MALLTQWFGVEPTGIIYGIARSLADAGCDLTVVSGSTGPGGDRRTAPASLRGVRSVVGGLPVVRFPFFRSHDSVSARRIATYASFAATTSVGAVPELAKNDVVLAYGSPATAASAAMLARRVRGTPYVFMVQDVWPDSIFASGFLTEGRVRSVAESSVGRFVTAAYRHSSEVVAITPGMRSLIVDRGVPTERVTAIYNWIEESARLPIVHIKERQAHEPLRIMYAGNLGGAQRIDVVLRAAARIGSGVDVTLVGGGVMEAELRDLVQREGITNVHFHPHVRRGELAALMGDQHLHLVSLADDPLFEVTLPSKTQSLLAAGAPILAAAPGETAAVVSRAEAGVVCSPGDVDSLVGAMRHAMSLTTSTLRAMGESGRQFYEREMAQAVGSARLVEVLKRASSDHRG